MDGYYYEVPDQNKICVFPFNYNGKEYTKCTNDYLCSHCYWCGTEDIVGHRTGWGMCLESCFKERGK